jgi:hypothetical protein
MNSECYTNGKPKRRFGSEENALRFEEEYRRNNADAVQQYAYACDTCGEWHLTSQPPGNHTIAQVRYDAQTIYTSGRERRNREEQAEVRERIAVLKAAGKSKQEIATELKMSKEMVYFYSSPARASNRNPSVESLQAQKEALERDMQQKVAAMMAQIKAKEEQVQAKIEAQQLRVRWTEVPSATGGEPERCVSIKKELNALVLTIDDAILLRDLLDELFAAQEEEVTT